MGEERKVTLGREESVLGRREFHIPTHVELEAPLGAVKIRAYGSRKALLEGGKLDAFGRMKDLVRRKAPVPWFSYISLIQS